jgi:probable F420-dependent oxidoreductase
MKFGFSIPTLTAFSRSSEKGPTETRLRYERSYQICQQAEELGYDFGTVGHHRFTPDTIDSSAPLVTLAAIASRTSKLRLCTNILLLPVYNPVEVAEQVAVLDEISGGRVILGVGLGYRPYEFLGVDYKARGARMDEAIAILRQAWAGEELNFSGQHFQVSGIRVAPRPIQPGGPPIWIGAQSKPAINRAARAGDAWVADNIQPLNALEPQVREFRSTANDLGRKADVVAMRKVGIGKTRQQVEEEWLPGILNDIRKYISDGVVFQDQEFKDRLLSGRKLGLSDLPPDLFVAGTPEDCIKQVQMCRDLLNPDYFLADFGRAAHGPEFERINEMFKLFGREVLSAFR